MLKILYRIEHRIGRIGNRIIYAAQFFRYLRLGIENGYPKCCVLDFAVGGWQGKHDMAMRRGSIFDGTDEVYIPCRFHVGRHKAWRAWNEDDVPWTQLRLFPDQIGKL